MRDDASATARGHDDIAEPPPSLQSSSSLRLLAVSLFLLRFGATMTAVNLPLLVVDRYGLGLDAGFTVAVELLPSVLFGPVIGDVIDRTDARLLAILGPLVTAPAVALFPFADALWQLQLLALVSGIGYMIGVPARMALRSRATTPGRETADNGVLVAAQRAATLLGPASSAVLVVVGFTPVFVTGAVTSVLAAMLLTRFPPPSVSVARARAEQDGQLAAGRRLIADLRRVFLTGLPELVRAVARDRPLAALSITAFTYQFGYGMTRLFLTGFALSLYPSRPSTYGMLVAVMGVGAVVGAACTKGLARLPQGWLYLGVNLLEAACWAGIVLAGDLVVAFVLVFVIGVAESVGTVVFYAEAQRRLPERMEGRFFAVLIPYSDAFVVIGTVVAGGVAAVGVDPTGWIIAAAVGVPVLLLAPVFLSSKHWAYDVDADDNEDARQ